MILLILSYKTKLIWCKTANLKVQPWKLKSPLMYDCVTISNFVTCNYFVICNYLIYVREIGCCPKSSLLCKSFYCHFCFPCKILRLSNLKTNKVMNFPWFHICTKGIIFLLLYNLHECSLNLEVTASSLPSEINDKKK